MTLLVRDGMPIGVRAIDLDWLSKERFLDNLRYARASRLDGYPHARCPYWPIKNFGLQQRKIELRASRRLGKLVTLQHKGGRWIPHSERLV